MKRITSLLIPVFLLIALLSVAQEQAVDEDELLSSADQQFEAGNYRQARNLYERFIETFPQHPQAARAAFRQAEAFSLDSTLQPRQRHSRAIEVYEVALERYSESPEAPRALYSLAQSYLHLGFVQDAIVQLRRARLDYPDAPNAKDILLLLADCYYYLDDFEQCTAFYRIFLDTYPEDDLIGEVLMKYAESLVMNGDHEDALSVFDRLQNTFPTMLGNNAELQYLRAQALITTDRLEQAQTNLTSLLARQDLELLRPYALYAMAKVEHLMALRKQGDERRQQLQMALTSYYRVYDQYGDGHLETASLLEMVRITDMLEITLSERYDLPSADTLLLNLYQRTLNTNMKALILARLAQHHRSNGRLVRALNNYKRLTDRFSDTEIASQTLSEYHRFLRELMDAALEVDDYDQYLNLFLTYGRALDLDLDDQFNIAIAYLRVGLFDEGEEIFEQLLSIGLSEERTRRVAVERMRYHFQRKQWQDARRQIYNVLRMNPSPGERELALFYEQEILYAQRDLEALQALFFDQPEKTDSPLLDMSILAKLARLQALEQNFSLAARYTGRIFNQFDVHAVDTPLLFPILKAAWLIRADALYMTEEYAAAADAYQRYLFYASANDSMAWALVQLAKSLEQIGRIEFARQALERFMEEYSDHTLAAEARHIMDRLTS